MDENVSDEKLRTLWCGSVSEKVDEEILYELFQNAGPLEKVSLPKDRDTGKQKPYAFIVFQHTESVKYAYDLLNGTELFRQQIRLQQKETGLGNELFALCVIFSLMMSVVQVWEARTTTRGTEPCLVVVAATGDPFQCQDSTNINTSRCHQCSIKSQSGMDILLLHSLHITITVPRATEVRDRA